MAENIQDERGLLQALLGDGRPFLTFIGLGLILSGGFALFLSANHHFLPHDVQFLGMTAEQLCGINSCRIVYFMFHDRVAFGGALIALGAIYMWLAEFPLRQGEAWAWWSLYQRPGRLRKFSCLSWLRLSRHLARRRNTTATSVLRHWSLAIATAPQTTTRNSITIYPRCETTLVTTYGLGRALLLATAAGMVAGGLIVMTVGMTWVFVPQDLEFMGVQPSQLQSISSRLVPLIAHDRAGLWRGHLTTGITVFCCVWCARPSKSLWQIILFLRTGWLCRRDRCSSRSRLHELVSSRTGDRRRSNVCHRTSTHIQTNALASAGLSLQ